MLPPPLTASLFSQIAELATQKQKGNPFKSVRMTAREREVVELIAEGLSNKEIATRLHLAVDTVKSHVHNILEKLALHTRLEIASFRHGERQFTSSQQAILPRTTSSRSPLHPSLSALKPGSTCTCAHAVWWTTRGPVPFSTLWAIPQRDEFR